jgi:hypothetical protein
MNIVGVVIAVVAAAVVLTLYYAPPVLGGRWAAAIMAWTGQSEARLSGDIPRRMGMWLVTAVVNAVVLAYLVDRLGITAVGDGVLLGAVVWAGFGTTFAFWPVAFANQPWQIWAINSGAFLIIQLLMGGILAAIG